jgi:CRISPR system Cascade subunit CasD
MTMLEFLGFRLFGTLSSWGTIAVGEERPTWRYPTKSAVIGLIAASLGLRRSDEAGQRHLAESLRIAVVVLDQGLYLKDYHTAQVPPHRRRIRYRTRRDELSSSELETILSSRSYLTDGDYLVLVQPTNGTNPDLSDIREALKAPAFVPYLGRKSCPVCLPLTPEIIQAVTLEEAISRFVGKMPHDALKALPAGDWQVFWEPGFQSDLPPVHTIERTDHPISRSRWLFQKRPEVFSIYRREAADVHQQDHLEV